MAHAWSEGFEHVTSLVHSEQAIWWLNGFWEEGAEEYKEDIWEMTHLMMEISAGQKMLYGRRQTEIKQEPDLDEFKAHVFLERLGETLTVRALRKRLDELDVDNNKRMALVEYLLAKYNKTPAEVASAPQGTGVPKHELDAAQKQLDDLNIKFQELSLAKDAAIGAAAKAAAAKKAAEQTAEDARNDAAAAADAAQTAARDEAAAVAAADSAKAAKEKADEKAELARQAEAKLKQAEEELRAAVEEVLAQEKIIADKIAGFEAIIADESAGGVKRNKAKNELAQTKSEDPLPLRRAKITQQAALRKAEKARKPFAIARSEAEHEARQAAKAADAAKAAADQAKQARTIADLAAQRAEQTKVEAEAAAERARKEKKLADEAAAELSRQVNEVNALVKEAEAVLAEMKSRKGTPHGKIWWMERQLLEAQKYMPRK